VRRRLLLPLLCEAFDVSAATNLIQNGSFETNGGPNSNVLNGWSIVNEVGGNGTWLAQTGTTGPVTSTCGPDDVAAPPDGSFAAMTSQSAEGSHVLYQDVTIPAGATAVLTFQFYMRSLAEFGTPDSLSFRTAQNQQFRVDVIDPASNPFTLDVLQSVLAIASGNPRVFGYDTQTAVLSGFGGRTVRIRFAEVDNQRCFYAGVDNVRLEVDGPPPAPAIIRFATSPRSIAFAAAATLSWSTQGATSIEIDNGIGFVPANGTYSVSLQRDTTYTIKATNAAGTAQRKVTIVVGSPGPQISFSASPDFIQKGGTATLRWSTTAATDVAIDNGIGAVTTSGSLVVTPAATTAYTVTASGGGLTSTSRATVFVDPGDVPIVSVTSSPSGIVQVAGTPSGTDRYALTNLGRVPTRITLTQTGDFFTQSPASFDLAAGQTQVVTITTTAQPAGKYEGTSTPAGSGVPSGLRVGVRLFVAVAPTGTVEPTTAVARTEIAAPAGENPSGSVSFTNRGTGTLQGIVTSDVAWLIPQSDVVVIGPGETKAVTFTTNRALRPDAASLAGAAVATLTLTYLESRGTSADYLILQTPAPGRGSLSVTVVDVVKAAAVPGNPPPLAVGEVAYFVAGLTQQPRSSGDVLLSVSGNSISDLKLFLGSPGASSIAGALDQLAPNSGLALPSIMQSIFASTATTGTVQARSASLSRVSLAGLQTNTANAFGSFITALPSFRSDRAIGANDSIHLAGVEKTLTSSTSVFIQEVGGLAATVRIDFLAPAGAIVGSQNTVSVAAFSLVSLPDVVPVGAVTVRVTNTSSGAARIVAYATVIDATTNDRWTVVDPSLIAASSADVIVALPAAPAGVAAVNTLYIVNPGSTALEINLTAQTTGARRRAVRPNDLLKPSPSGISISAGQTSVVLVPAGEGFARITAARPFVASARSMQTIAGRGGNFGAALPVVPAGASMGPGESRRFASIDDASRITVGSSTPVTYRSNVGLIETAGQAANVKLTLRYTFSAGSKTSAQGVSSATVPVPANRLVMINEVARSVIGGSRDGYGDLHNMQLDVEVVSGGRVIPFVQTIDNGSLDSVVRTQ
jgi:hypothetical protein